MVTLNAHFDGKVLVPDEPLALAPNQKVRISVEPVEAPSVSVDRVSGRQRAAFVSIADDFNAELSDDFWGI